MKRIDILIVGGGQAGLALGYYLKKQGLNFLIVESSSKVGNSWRRRWDSLILFTPRSFCSLPGLKFLHSSHNLLSKDEMADYLQNYAEYFSLPVELSYSIAKLQKVEEGFVARSSKGDILASKVVIATGTFNTPMVPSCSTKLNKSIWQSHSHDYSNPSDVPQGQVVIVGRGNSGAQIALELSKSHEVSVISGKDLFTLPQTFLGINIFWWLKLFHILDAKKSGRWSKWINRQGDIIIGKKYERAVKYNNIKTINARLDDANDSELLFSDGSRIPAESVLWATGYKSTYEWVDIKGTIDDKGFPLQQKGRSSINGLFWLGLPWQTSLKSGLIYGVRKDAKLIAKQLAKA